MNNTGWPIAELGDHVEILAGFAFKSKMFSDDPADIPLVKGENVHQGFIDWNGAKRWPRGDFAEYSKYRLSSGDVVIAMDRPWIEAGLKYAWISKRDPQSLLVQRVARLRCKNGLCQDYIKYLVGSQAFTNYIKPIVTGVTVPHISATQISKFRFLLPPLPVQHKIAAILSAYDDLIENNLRRIKILEEMAQNLYREWFVKFRFPGHQHTRFVDSPLGSIPEGWEVVKLAEVANVNQVQINLRSAPAEIHYIDISSVSPGQIDSITTYAFPNAPGRARRVVQHGDVLWSCVRPNRRSHALILHPESNTIASTGFAVLTAKKVPFPFLYFITTTDDFVSYLTNNATGAAYPAVTAATFEKADLIISPMPLLMKFGDLAIPITEQIHSLQSRIEILRRTRDLLLPKLISGEVDVSEVDIAVTEETAA